MEAEGAHDIRQQVLQNQEELQNVLKDLENWEKDVKKKEEELKFIKMSEEDTIPPIRNTTFKSKKKNRHKKQKEKEKSSPPQCISSYNYNAWEKFDVESEIKKLDEEKKESSESSENSDTEEQLQIQQKKQLAILKKDKGNDFFKKGNYDSAINCYTIGMELDPNNPLLPANRAMAFIKKEQFQAAENDCTLCISLDPSYVKAYLRRGTSRKALKKLSLAQEDYLKVLELEPDNKLAKTELEKLKEELSDNRLKNSSETLKKMKSESENNDIKIADKTPSSRLENLISSMEKSQELLTPSDGVKSISSVSSNFPQTSYSKNTGRADKSVDIGDLSEIENVIKKLEQSLPPVPSAAFQFLTDWRKLSKYPDLKYQYLKQFPPEKFPVLFKHDIEAELLCGILETLSTSFLENGDDVFPYLKFLTQVGRFQTLLLFLSNEEKKGVMKLVESLKTTKHSQSLEVQQVIKCYKM